MENEQDRVLLDGSSGTARVPKQDPNQPTAVPQYQDQLWSPLRQTTSDDNAKDGGDEELEHVGDLKFAFPRKVKADGRRRKANVSKRRVTFADH